MRWKNLKIPRLKKTAKLILLIELPLILLYAVVMLIMFLSHWETDPLGAAFYYAELLVYIPVSVMISVGTALVADLIEREQTKK